LVLVVKHFLYPYFIHHRVLVYCLLVPQEPWSYQQAQQHWTPKFAVAPSLSSQWVAINISKKFIFWPLPQGRAPENEAPADPKSKKGCPYCWRLFENDGVQNNYFVFIYIALYTSRITYLKNLQLKKKSLGIFVGVIPWMYQCHRRAGQRTGPPRQPAGPQVAPRPARRPTLIRRVAGPGAGPPSPDGALGQL
jgi:hypothetical protein